MVDKKQVNVDFTKFPELLVDLDQMVDDDGTDRSKFIRKLIREEKARRDAPQVQGSLPTPNPRKRNAARRAAQISLVA